MTNLYLDTNFFLYISKKTSPFYKDCANLIDYCSKNQIKISTSCETIQEIIHLAKNTKVLDKGISASKKTIKLIDELLPLTKDVIRIYLDLAQKYRSSTSRDLVHLASCLENNIDKIITHDSDFKKFKEVKSLTPEEFVASQAE